jgi:hypothetical protein
VKEEAPVTEEDDWEGLQQAMAESEAEERVRQEVAAAAALADQAMAEERARQEDAAEQERRALFWSGPGWRDVQLPPPPPLPPHWGGNDDGGDDDGGDDDGGAPAQA